MKPPDNINFAWCVEKVEAFWYWFDALGKPHGPYLNEEEAHGFLSDYADSVDERDWNDCLL
jgi:hypothetical protein